jgi:hypothetical protein
MTDPTDVTSADVNGDGLLDLIAGNESQGNVVVGIGNGQGGFTVKAGSPFSNGATQANGVVAGLSNGDGNVDLMTASYGDGKVSLLIGDGTGSFAAGTPITVATGTIWIATADFNASKLDAAVVNASANTVAVLLGNGAGGFTQPPGSPYPSGVTGLRQVAPGRFDADGDVDIAIVGGSNQLSILDNNGAGTFSVPAGYPVAIPTSEPFGVAAGDLDGDGLTDLAVPDLPNDEVLLLYGATGRRFFASAPLRVGNAPIDIEIADADGDGDLDMFTADYNAVLGGSGSSISVLLGDGNGGFSLAGGHPFFMPSFLPDGLTVGDFDRDGAPTRRRRTRATATWP